MTYATRVYPDYPTASAPSDQDMCCTQMETLRSMMLRGITTPPLDLFLSVFEGFRLIQRLCGHFICQRLIAERSWDHEKINR